jgi:hypothetical protein
MRGRNANSVPPPISPIGDEDRRTTWTRHDGLARWMRSDGSRLVLLNDRTLMETVGPAGVAAVALRRASDAEVEAYAASQGYRLRWWHGRDRPRQKKPPRPPRATTQERSSDGPRLNEAQQAEIDARLLAHQQRVAAEVARIEASVRRAQAPAATSTRAATT